MTTHSDPARHGKTWRRSALAAVLLAGTPLGGFAIGNSGFAATSPQQNTSAEENSNAPVNPHGNNAMQQPLPDFTGLVEQVKPAVVSITTKLKPQAAQQEMGQQGMQELPFPFSQMFPQNHPQMRAVEARGSGFIIDTNGTIVTNNHVVEGEQSVSVKLDDGTTLPAKIIGRDKRTDIAVLKVDAGHPLPYIQLGNSQNVKPGEWVVAMGNPFGLGGSVTHGIVSAVSRDIGEGPYDQFIQVDAPINRGNSGGPLFTQQGKVIGMNTAILSPSGGSIGIGFAIPSDMIRTVVSQIEQNGKVVRGYIGVEAQALKGSTAKALDLPDNSGALIAGVQPDTPAAHAGLQPGDVIQSVNGHKIADPRDLAVQVAGIQPGQEAHLKVLRDGKTQDMSLHVSQMPNEQTASNDQGGGAEHQNGGIGLALAPLSPDLRNQLDLPDNAHGAVVRGVRPGSPAESAGLKSGDVIVGVNTHPVHSPSEAAREIRSAMNGQNHAVALRVIRNGQALFVGINGQQENNAG